MSAMITIEFVVPAGYQQGDYAQLHGNGGDGNVDWNNPLTDEFNNLFPDGAGVYGWGHAPWGHFRWGHGHSMNCLGWGHLPWGHFPWGHGSGEITAKHQVDSCGTYKFGLACYDELGNPHTGTPEEATVNVHIAPLAPSGLKKNSYDKETDILVLDVA